MKVYTRQELAAFNLMAQPVWVFDVEKNAMWWANKAAVKLWGAQCLQDLIQQRFASDISERSAQRLLHRLARLGEDDRIKNQLTFHPDGRVRVTVITSASGIAIEGGRIAMLVEGVEKGLLDAAAEVSAVGNFETIDKCEKRRKTTSALLFDVFPRHVADALKEGRKVEPEHKSCVSVYFSDIVGFTNISSSLSPLKVSDMLDRLYEKFDALSRKHEVFKVETIGDSYMCASNLIMDQHDHSKRMAAFAMDSIRAANETMIDSDDPALGYVNIRVGLHAGPIVANVVGTRAPRYCLFGNTVNVSSRMESNSKPGRIQCSEAYAKLLEEQHARVHLVPRGKIQVKGKGEMSTYWVEEGPTQISILDQVLEQLKCRKGVVSEGQTMKWKKDPRKLPQEILESRETKRQRVEFK